MSPTRTDILSCLVEVLLSQEPEPTVAPVAQQPAHEPRFMAVIDHERARVLTYRAGSALRREHRVVGVDGDAVAPLQVPRLAAPSTASSRGDTGITTPFPNALHSLEVVSSPVWRAGIEPATDRL